MSFVKAQRRQAKLKIALTGPSGSGKTYSALSLASGMGKKIALIDTENGSASLYADKFDFDTVIIEQPYTVAKYSQAVKEAETAGYEVLIIDSISHAWAGEGGLLAEKESLDARGGNSYTNWSAITKKQEQFKSMLLNCDLHLICTMRSKQDYIMETNEKGKQAPKKVGLAPVQRDGMEYEFTTVLDVAMNHEAQASKDRTGLFDGLLFKISKDTGLTLIKWLGGGAPNIVPAKPQVEKPAPKEAVAEASEFPNCPNCKAQMKVSKSGKHYFCPNWKDGGEHNPIKITKKPKDAEEALFGEPPPPDIDVSEPLPAFEKYK